MTSKKPIYRRHLNPYRNYTIEFNNKYDNNDKYKKYYYKKNALNILKYLYSLSGGILAAYICIKDNNQVDITNMGFIGLIGYLCPTVSYIVGGAYLLKEKYNNNQTQIN